MQCYLTEVDQTTAILTLERHRVLYCDYSTSSQRAALNIKKQRSKCFYTGKAFRTYFF